MTDRVTETFPHVNWSIFFLTAVLLFALMKEISISNSFGFSFWCFSKSNSVENGTNATYLIVVFFKWGQGLIWVTPHSEPQQHSRNLLGFKVLNRIGRLRCYFSLYTPKKAQRKSDEYRELSCIIPPSICDLLHLSAIWASSRHALCCHGDGLPHRLLLLLLPLESLILFFPSSWCSSISPFSSSTHPL